MMIVVRGGAHTCMAGLVAVLDREDTAGTTAAPPRCGRSDIQHVPRPAQRASCHGGRCTVLDDEAADMLLLDSGKPRRPGRAAHT